MISTDVYLIVVILHVQRNLMRIVGIKMVNVFFISFSLSGSVDHEILATDESDL